MARMERREERVAEEQEGKEMPVTRVNMLKWKTE